MFPFRFIWSCTKKVTLRITICSWLLCEVFKRGSTSTLGQKGEQHPEAMVVDRCSDFRQHWLHRTTQSFLEQQRPWIKVALTDERETSKTFFRDSMRNMRGQEQKRAGTAVVQVRVNFVLNYVRGRIYSHGQVRPEIKDAFQNHIFCKERIG